MTPEDRGHFNKRLEYLIPVLELKLRELRISSEFIEAEDLCRGIIEDEDIWESGDLMCADVLMLFVVSLLNLSQEMLHGEIMFDEVRFYRVLMDIHLQMIRVQKAAEEMRRHDEEENSAKKLINKLFNNNQNQGE